jgi:hypothetical protein
MASKKIDRALYGPSWAEVILGAALSFGLGLLLAAALLILKPVPTVRELPKEPVPGVVYYIEGSKDATKGKLWASKHQMLASGTSVALTEDELNAIFASAPDKSKPAAAPPAPKGQPATPAAPATPPLPANAGLIVPGTPNFRIHDNQLQIAWPCTLNVLGFNQAVIVMATGGFSKTGDGFVFAPDDFYVGSLRVSRLPMLEGLVTKKILEAQPLPADLTAVWQKLSNVAIDGKTLKLTL